MGTKRTNDGQVKEKKKNDKKRALTDEDQVSKAVEDVEGENPDIGGDVVKEEQEEEVEVEAISHAEQRKRRKLEKKKLVAAAANGIDGADDVETDTNKQPKGDKTAKKADSKASDKESRSGFGVWVGNLAFRTDAAKVGWQNPSQHRELTESLCSFASSSRARCSPQRSLVSICHKGLKTVLVIYSPTKALHMSISQRRIKSQMLLRSVKITWTVVVY